MALPRTNMVGNLTRGLTSPDPLYWTNPSDGGALSGRTTYVGFASSDDHVVEKLDLSIECVCVGSKLWGSVSYECQLSYR